MSEIVLRRIQATRIPDGYTEKKKGFVHKTDLAYDSVNSEWIEPTKFMVGSQVDTWNIIAKKKIPSSLSKLIKASQVNNKRR